ncbi:MAG: mannitol dehydrogenase family protein [bacterium]|nr:mannitol dehydrogenase family protein [bacterium]
MRLTEEGLFDREAWEQAGYQLPQYDRKKVRQLTVKEPEWIHFGAGNIFRAFQANVVQTLLNKGSYDKGLIVAEGFDYEIIEKSNRPHDDYSILVTLKADGSVEKTVVGSIVESLTVDSTCKKDFDRLVDIFCSDSLKMVSFTITEKGYKLENEKGELNKAVVKDMENGPEKAESYMGKVTALMYQRYLTGEKPVALVSMDNCSHNGDKLHEAVLTFARNWEDKNKVKKGFTGYLEDKQKVSFPWTMIDKITPRPDPNVEELLRKDGIEQVAPIVTSKHTYVAPFVNAEESQYLVMEDWFLNGRIPLEAAGIIYTDRKTVDQVEKMKVCTCLNPLHTALAVFGCLLGYTRICDEMKDDDLVRLIETVGYKEGLPVVVDPKIMNPKEFIDQVMTVRLPNPFMPDTPQRIATDTSQKLAIRYGETMKAYVRTRGNCKELIGIPLVIAGWLRYLMGVDDEGNTFTLSPDPLLETLYKMVGDIKIGEAIDVHGKIEKILKNDAIFGVDLYKVGLGEKIEYLFAKMIEKEGAVRETLHNQFK